MPGKTASVVADPRAVIGGRAQWQLRVMSALVLAPPVLLVAYLGFPWFEMLLVAAAFLMAFEWSRLTLDGARPIALGVTAATAAVGIAAAALGNAAAGFAIVAVGALTAAVSARLARDSAGWAAFGVVYIAIPCVSAAWLREGTPAGRELVLWLFPTIWASDVAAYIVGSALNGPRLAPRISPKKTWAGAAGGLLGAAATAALAGPWLGVGGASTLAVLGGLASIAGQLGDLLKSMVKRRFGVKDTGRLIPGHGGIIDRVDALLTAVPLVAAIAWLNGGRMPAW